MKFLPRFLLAALSATCLIGTASAASYPDRPIRLIVPFAAGGTVNLVARVLAERLSVSLGQQVLVDNRPGAGGTLGAAEVAKSAPDGYTLLLAASSHQSLHQFLYKKLPYDPQRAFTQVALFATVPNVMVVSNKVPAKNVKELIAAAKGGRKFFMGSSGNGGVNHLIGELFMHRAGVEFDHVPYKGAGPATADLLSGQIDLMFANLPNVMPHIQSGKVRVLAVASEKRLAALPDVPTITEAGVPGVVVESWSGVLAPAGTPQAIVDKLAAEIVKVANEKETKDVLASQGAVPMPGKSAEYAALVRTETQRWGDIVKNANITLD